MTEPANKAADLIAQARASSHEALGRLYETYQRYLTLVAERELDASSPSAPPPCAAGSGRHCTMLCQGYVPAAEDLVE